MSNYPTQLDDDVSLPRVDDNITEIGPTAINQLRSAMFAVERELGLGGSGSSGSVAARIGTSINANGTLKPSAIVAAGAIVGPIADADVSPTAAIAESKLLLAHTTQDLFNLIVQAENALNTIQALTLNLNTDFLKHISGQTSLSSGQNGRHVLSHIDINANGTDSRDTFTWPGDGYRPKNKSGGNRNYGNLALFLKDMNDELIKHENADGSTHLDGSKDKISHPAASVSVDTSSFVVIPPETENVQELANFIDQNTFAAVSNHQQNHHVNGISRTCRGSILSADGYGVPVVPVTSVKTYLLHDSSGTVEDNNSTGDDVIEFTPISTTNNVFDSQFSQVRAGDVITVNYGAVEVAHIVDSVRYTYDGATPPNKKFYVRINGRNIEDSSTAIARIDRPLFSDSKFGVLNVSAVNNPFSKLGSLLVANPRGAVVLGIGFDPSKLNSTHYKLYLEYFPTGNPSEKAFIYSSGYDVTGNAGATPGKYTLDSVVEATNNAFRKEGVNARYVAFQYNGEFGIMLADPYGNAGFSVINGFVNSSGVLSASTYTNNVIGDAAGDGFDALGFGANGANVASPPYLSTYASVIQSQYPCKLFLPLKNKNYYVNGLAKDYVNDQSVIAKDSLGDGYWPATITSATTIPGTTVKVTYTVDADLSTFSLAPGKSLVVLPDLPYSSGSLNMNDYGRFIIETIVFQLCNSVVTGSNLQGTSGSNIVYSPTVNFGSINVEVGHFISITGVSGLLDHYQITAVNGNYLTLNNNIATTFASASYTIYSSQKTLITVYNGVANNGNVTATTSTNIPVHLYFGDDSVGFDVLNLTDANSSSKYKRYYEVYANEAGRTFAHERARFVVNDSPTTNMAQINFVKVSPKLRGYSSSSLGKSTIRLTVNAFDSTTGIFTAFLSNPTVSTQAGLTVTGKQGQVTRLYDVTGVDYIDFIYSLSDTVSTFSTPNHFDIDLFKSIALDETNFFIAGCQVNDLTYKVEYIKDERSFGNVSEADFTNSAISFVQSGERILHSNGVIRGFEQINNTNNLYSFKGGSALVNGKIIEKNDFTVALPILQEAGPVSGTHWALCLNDKAEIQLIPITSINGVVDRVFTALNPANAQTYKIDSVKFSDLCVNRKDLTILYLVDASVTNSTTYSFDVYDARRYVKNSNLNASLVWTSDEGNGTFTSFDALLIWLNYNSTFNNTVVVRGKFAITQSYLLEFTNPVKFIGDRAVLDVSADYAWELSSNVSIEGIRFNYTKVVDNTHFPSGALLPPSEIMVSPRCAIKLPATASNVSIKDCTFTFNAVPHYPGIYSSLPDSGTVMQDVVIDGNKFINLTTADDKYGVIVFDCKSAGDSVSTLSNVRITNNTCSNNQIIALVCGRTVSSGIYTFNQGRLVCSNVLVEGNVCGTIGYVTMIAHPSEASNTVSGGYALADKQSHLIIRGNSCKYITNMDNRGYAVKFYGDDVAFAPTDAPTMIYGSGAVSILENTCNWIHVGASSLGDPNDLVTIAAFGSGVNIRGNRLFASKSNYLTNFVDVRNGSPAIPNAAIILRRESNSIGFSQSIVSENTIEMSAMLKVDDTTQQYGYQYGILTFNNSNIINNKIQAPALSSGAYGIFIDSKPTVICSGNSIARGPTDIAFYIGGRDNTATNNVSIINNSFDDLAVDEAGTTFTDSTGFISPTWRYENNTNQVGYIAICLKHHIDFRDLPGSGTSKYTVYNGTGYETTLYTRVVATTTGAGEVDAAFCGKFSEAIPLNTKPLEMKMGSTLYNNATISNAGPNTVELGTFKNLDIKYVNPSTGLLDVFVNTIAAGTSSIPTPDLHSFTNSTPPTITTWANSTDYITHDVSGLSEYTNANSASWFVALQLTFTGAGTAEVILSPLAIRYVYV